MGRNENHDIEVEETTPPPRRSGRAIKSVESRILEDMIRSTDRCDELALELTKETNRTNINIKTGDSALLHIACRVGNNAAIALLLEAGADLNLKDNSSLEQTPLDIAYHSKQEKTAIYLLEKGAQFTASVGSFFPGQIERTLWTWSARYGSCQSLDHLLLLNIPIDTQENSGNTALHVACSYGQKQAADLLLSRGASIQKLNFKKESFFDKCKGGGSESLLATALRDIHLPLHALVKRNDFHQLSDLLLSQDNGTATIDIHKYDEKNLTAFQFALLTSQKEACQIFLFGTTNRSPHGGPLPLPLPCPWTPLTPSQSNRIKVHLSTPSGWPIFIFTRCHPYPLEILASNENDVMIDWLLTTVLSLPNTEDASSPFITDQMITNALFYASHQRPHAERAMIKLAEFGGDIYHQQPILVRIHGFSVDTLSHLSFGQPFSVEFVERLTTAFHSSFKLKNWFRRRAFLEFLCCGGFYSGPKAPLSLFFFFCPESLSKGTSLSS
jgi:ankyrin repeat protein